MFFKKKNDFFSSYSFDSEEISYISAAFGTCLIENIKEDLASSRYSLSIDNATVGDKSICGLKVRYLKEITDDDGLSNFHIENKIIGLKYLEESSDGKTIHDIIQEKLFNSNANIKKNFIGLTHDNAGALKGSGIGLVGRVKSDIKHSNFYDLSDPCHNLNLVTSKSYKSLPDDITDFINNINNHFSYSPQRVEKLINIQISKGYPQR